MYALTSGHSKPAKQLKLGLAMKKLTSSRKVLEILNRFGHTPGYHVIEELETELTFNATKNALMTPHGMTLSPNLSTGVAFDNFDSF